jgi:hypothetical protein
MAYFDVFSGMFEHEVQTFLEETLELLVFGDELYMMEIGYGSQYDPIDLTEDDDDDEDDEDDGYNLFRFWVNVDEIENGCAMLNR